ncbi:MAG: hypothetical protein ACT4O6_24175 [Reyranella sp.]
MLLGAAVLIAPPVQAQSESQRAAKLQAWIAHTISAGETAPMSNGQLLDFPTASVRRAQVGIVDAGVQRLFAVVIPQETNGVVIASGYTDSRTFNIHRTGAHGRRISSARAIGGKVDRWSGKECNEDFLGQLNFWIARPLP